MTLDKLNAFIKINKDLLRITDSFNQEEIIKFFINYIKKQINNFIKIIKKIKITIKLIIKKRKIAEDFLTSSKK